MQPQNKHEERLKKFWEEKIKIRTYIEDQLKKIGIDKPICLQGYDSPSPMAAQTQTLFLNDHCAKILSEKSGSTFSELLEELNQTSPLQEDGLLTSQYTEGIKTALDGTIQHEGMHIKENHILKRNFAALLIPLATHVIAQRIPLLSTKYSSAKIWKEQVQQLFSGLGKYFINLQGYLAYIRFTETEADRGMIDNIELLENTKYGFELLKEWNDDLEKRKPQLAFTINTFFATHPSFESRIAALDKRIDTLKNPEKAVDEEKQFQMHQQLLGGNN